MILPKSADNPVAAAIRKAIGASETEAVTYSARPVSRLPGWPDPAYAPKGFAEFTRLFDMNAQQLKALGLGEWDGGLFLFPGEWYEHIPDGFPVETINGKVRRFKRGTDPKDLGFGCLAYGVRIGPPTDEEA